MGKPVVLIMAGGKGERFWPRSTIREPKQLHKVYSDRTLLEETIIRAKKITSKERIYIGCNPELKRAVLKTHKGINEKNFIVEPMGRNTAPIVALAALELEKRHPGDVQVILSADHFIQPLSLFAESMKSGVELASLGYLVTLGIKPSRPETGYGYIHAGKTLPNAKHTGGRSILSFVEKPDTERALQYIKQSDFFWNSGIFLWKGSVILKEFEEHAPSILHPLQKANSLRELKKIYPTLPALPVDIAILEKSKNIALLPVTFTWDDVGSWLSLERICPPIDENKNIWIHSGKKGGRLVGRNASSNIILTDRSLVALLGVHNLIVVEKGETLFVTDKRGVGEIKELIGDLKKNPSLQKYLK